MQIGQSHDKRKYRRLKSTDYYEAKAAAEAPVADFPKCELCGLTITGKSFGGSKEGSYICLECWNETG